MAKKYLYVSKSKTRKLLELYTLEGRTQEEAGNIVFRRTNLHGLTAMTAAQRIFHYLGVNMNYRNDVLTKDIIRQVLNHKLLAFPLQIPIEGPMQPTLNFHKEVDRLLQKNTPAYRRIEHLKSFAALVFILLLDRMFRTRTVLIIIPVCMLASVGFLLMGVEEGQSVGQFIKANIFAFIFIFLIMCGSMLQFWS